MMKTPLLAVLALWICCLAGRAEEKEVPKKPFDPKALSGTYTFNPSCTDEMAIVKVQIRKATDKEGDTEEWRADGTMDNSFHGTVVTFKGAFVTVNEDGSVDVSAQFFSFTLKDKELEWGDGYHRGLSLVEEEEDKKEAPSGK